MPISGPRSLVILSGGLDSSTLAFQLAELGHELVTVTFFYGQRHRRELESAAKIAMLLTAKHMLINIADVGTRLRSALTMPSEVPDGHYTEESMKITVVPNRNAIFLAAAFGLAASNDCQLVATAVHSGDHAVYPDCRPEFLKAFQAMQDVSIPDGPQLHAPFVNKSKADIARVAGDLGLPIELTWSCYKGGDKHCGRCGTCVERQEALYLANVEDPTPYLDPTYWHGATLAHDLAKSQQ